MPKSLFDLNKEENIELEAITKRSVCFLLAGIGQKYHTVEEWRETIQKMNDHFAACVIVPVDELHRFTEMMKNKDLSESDARTMTILAGHNWLSEVAHLNAKFRIPVMISHWSEWTSTQGYDNSKVTVDENYNDEESDFRTDVDIVINTFVMGFINNQVKSKTGDHHIKLNILKAVNLCKLYLLEELAFVDMIKNKQVCPQVSDFFTQKELRHLLTGYNLCLISEIDENAPKIGKIYLKIENDEIKYRTHLTPNHELAVLQRDDFPQGSRFYTELYQGIEQMQLNSISYECITKLLQVISKKGHAVSKPLFMAYPFGHNSTNEDVYNCFEKLCARELSFINLSKPPKKPRNKQKHTNDETHHSITNLNSQDTIFVSIESMKEQISSLQESSAEMHANSPDKIISNNDGNKSSSSIFANGSVFSQPTKMIDGKQTPSPDLNKG